MPPPGDYHGSSSSCISITFQANWNDDMRQLTRQNESVVLVHWGLRYAWEYCNRLSVPDTFPDKTKKLIVKRVDRYQLSDGHPFSW